MGNSGKVLMIFKGDYNASTTYQKLNVVYYNNRSYVCKQTSTGNAPTNTTYWQALTGDASAEIQALTNYVGDNNVKNILPNDKTSQTIDGVTFTVNSDGSITADGTATTTVYYKVLYATDYPLTAGKQYKLSGCPAGGGNTTYRLQAEMNGQVITNAQDDGNGTTFTAPEFNTRFAVYIRIPNGYTISNKLFKPMITEAFIPNSDYAHYQPYAKTNVELTSDLTFKTASTAITGVTETYNALECVIDFNDASLGEVGNSWTYVFTASKPPKHTLVIPMLCGEYWVRVYIGTSGSVQVRTLDGNSRTISGVSTQIRYTI